MSKKNLPLVPGGRPDSRDSNEGLDAALVRGPKAMKPNKWNSPEKQDCDLSYMDEKSRQRALKMMDETNVYWRCYPRIIVDLTWLPWIRTLLKVAFPGLANPAKDQATIASAIRKENPGTVISMLSVRTFLDTLFTVLDWPAGSEIIMTGITIPHVVDIIKHHKLVPRVVDLEVMSFTPDMNQARSLVNEKTKMVMAAPVFGRTMSCLNELKQLAAQNNLTFLIDAAQCFGIQHHIDAMDADITTCSYGFIKYSSALGGSVSVVKNLELADKIKALDAKNPRRSTGKQWGNMAKSAAVLYVDDPLTYGVVRRIAESLGVDTPDLVHSATRGFPGNDLIKLIRFRPHPAGLALLAERLTNRDPKVNKLRSISGWHFMSQVPSYIQNLSAGNPERPEECTFWLHAFVCRDPLTVCKILHQNGFDSSLGASQMTAVGTAAEAPVCHTVINNVLYVPMPIECSESDRIAIIKIIHQIPRIAIETPLQAFHDHVASTPEKHAYRSPEVTALLKGRPLFTTPVSSLVMTLGGPIAAALVSKM